MMLMNRIDQRKTNELRPITIESGFQKFPEGSVVYRCGETRVLISASVEAEVPRWMQDTGEGWLTAEYAMHPRANPERKKRARAGKIDGRSQEIQRLIGRALRAAVDFKKLGPRMITIDCDVLDADGGTRTASITGGFVALALAAAQLRAKGIVEEPFLRAPVAAISVGLLDDVALLDLCYVEDRDAAVDLNVVGTAGGELV